MHQADAPHGAGLGEAGDGEGAVGPQQAQRPLRDDRRPHAVRHHPHHGRQRRGHGDRRVDAVALAQGEGLVPQAIALVEHQQLLVVELGGADVVPSGPGVVGGDEDDEGLVVHGHDGGAAQVDVYGDDRGVEPPPVERVEDVVGHHLAQLGLEPGQLAPQAVEDDRGEVGGEGRDEPQPEHPAQGGPLAGDGLGEGLGGEHRLAGVGQERLAQRGDQDPAGGALHQLAAHALLQGRDRLGQARLAHPERAGRLAEVLVVAQRDEGAQL